MRKRRSLVRPRMSGSLGNEESKTELEKVDEAAEAVPGVNAVAELVPEAVKDVEVAQPSKAEEEVFEESHGKARWTRRRSLRRNMRTMGDLRGSARLRSLQDANASDCAVEGSHHYQEPTPRQSLPSLRRAEKEQEDYSRPPTPQEKPETPPPPPQQQQPALHPEEPISPPPSPPLPPQQQEPHPQPIKPRAPFLTHAYTPRPRPRSRAIPPPSKDQHQPKDPRSNPPPPYNPPTPSHSTAFTRAQSILLDLKSPLKGFINTYPYISPGPIFTSPATLQTAPPPTNGAANATVWW
ncbi:hypothetical protein EV426DRAFT_583498 [Tirmania nivea]|nr:hypothetical protein EV426DRAFT_583498 [Tirmania nivea]